MLHITLSGMPFSKNIFFENINLSIDKAMPLIQNFDFLFLDTSKKMAKNSFFYKSRSFEGKIVLSRKLFSLIDCISQVSKGIIMAS